jgi:hypothetical protein
MEEKEILDGCFSLKRNDFKPPCYKPKSAIDLVVGFYLIRVIFLVSLNSPVSRI